jgi:predicted Zn-dependent peptidase
VSASEVQAVAQKYLNPDRAHIVAVGDAARIRPALAKLGTVES